MVSFTDRPIVGAFAVTRDVERRDARPVDRTVTPSEVGNEQVIRFRTPACLVVSISIHLSTTSVQVIIPIDEVTAAAVAPTDATMATITQLDATGAKSGV